MRVTVAVHVKGDDGHQHEGSLELAQQLRTTTCIAVKGGICFQKKCQGICESNGFNAATAFCYKPPGLHLPQCCCPWSLISLMQRTHASIRMLYTHINWIRCVALLIIIYYNACGVFHIYYRTRLLYRVSHTRRRYFCTCQKLYKCNV